MGVLVDFWQESGKKKLTDFTPQTSDLILWVQYLSLQLTFILKSRTLFVPAVQAYSCSMTEGRADLHVTKF